MKKILLIVFIIILTNCSNSIETYDNVGSIYYCGSRSSSEIYLTFDDGYPYINTKEILKILNEKKITAAFFFEGDFMLTSKSLILEIIESGHIVANHTYSHGNLTTMSDKEIIEDIMKFEELYYEITGQTLIKYFRPPQGEATQENLDLLQKLGYNIIYWTVNYYDWDRSNELGYEYAYDYITENTTNGDIILMHTLTDSNVDALPLIIDKLILDGYTFASLDYLVSIREKNI